MKLLTLGLLITILSNSFAQETSTGVFLTMKPSKNYKDFAKIVSIRGGSKKFYVPLNPIISALEFTKVSDIKNDPVINSTYFYLYFSEKGIDNLKVITSKIEGGQLVFVVDDSVVGYIKTMGEILNKSIQINGTLNSPDVQWAHSSLKKIIENRK